MECPECGNEYKNALGVSAHWGKIHKNIDKPQWLIEELSGSQSGEKNPMYGKTFSHTEETKQKISESSKERWEDEEYKERVVEKIKQNREWDGHSEETKKKISESLTGRSLSEETKEKLKGKTEGEKNGMYGKTGSDHPMGGNTISEKHKQKISESNSGVGNGMYGKTGEDHPRFQSEKEYGESFTYNLKEFVREFYQRKCQLCGKDGNNSERRLDVHHMDANKKNNNLNNLFPFCRSCHQKMEWHIDYE